MEAALGQGGGSDLKPKLGVAADSSLSRAHDKDNLPVLLPNPYDVARKILSIQRPEPWYSRRNDIGFTVVPTHETSTFGVAIEILNNPLP